MYMLVVWERVISGLLLRQVLTRAAAKMSPRIRTSPEAVLADHAPPPSAAAATARRKPDQIPITGTEFQYFGNT